MPGLVADFRISLLDAGWGLAGPRDPTLLLASYSLVMMVLADTLTIRLLKDGEEIDRFVMQIGDLSSAPKVLQLRRDIGVSVACHDDVYAC